MINCNTVRSESDTDEDESFSEDTRDCDSYHDFDRETVDRSTSSYSPILSPSSQSTMDRQGGGAVLTDISPEPYFPPTTRQEPRLPSLYQVATEHEPDDGDAITLAFCGQAARGGDFSPIRPTGQAVCSRVSSSDHVNDRSLQYDESAFSDYHHPNSNHHLVVEPSANHQSSPHQFVRQELMLGANSSIIDHPVQNGLLADSSALNSTSPSMSSSRRLPLPFQSPVQPMNPHNQARRGSSSSGSSSVHPNPNGYGGNVFESVLSPVVDGCHTHHQAYPWNYVTGADVPFVESLLPSPVSTLFPFPPNSAHYDSNPFAFFASPVSNVNTPTPSTNTFQYFHQQAHAQQHHPQPTSVHLHQHLQQQQIQNHHHQNYSNPYLNRNLHFQQHTAISNMPQPSYTGFAPHTMVQQKQTKKGGRRPKEEQQQLAPEEEEKRKLRRTRNKEAAARCRKRRLDHMTDLSGQVAQLQETQAMLEREVEQLEKEKEELEFVLKTHEPACRLRGQQMSINSRTGPPQTKKMAMGTHQPAGITVTANKVFLPSVKSDPDSGASAVLDCDDKMDPPLSMAAGMKKFGSASILSGNWTTASSAINRPDTLHFRTAGDMDSPGILINTPSKVFTFDVMNGLNMPTGLTPVNSGLTPMLSLANAAATLETPTTSVMGSLDGSNTNGGTNSQKALHPL